MDYIIAIMNYYGCFNSRGTTKSNGKKKWKEKAKSNVIR